MGQQSGGSKGSTLPNPNYGSGSGVDNSNGVYNAGQSAQAAAQGSTPLESTATPAAAPQGGYSPITPANTQKGQSGNKSGQPPTMDYGPNSPTQSTMTAQAALGQQAPSYSSYDGQDHTPPPAATPPATTPPATTTAAAQPMQGSAIANYAQSKMQSKGQQPQMAQGTQGGMISGMANATTGNAAVPAQLPTNTGNPWTDMQNRQKNNQAAYAGAPSWMKNVLAGQDMFGGTNESRAKYEMDNNLGARSNAGENTYEHGGTDQNWQGWATKVSGESDPWEAMRKIAAMARNSPKGIGAMADVRRSMEASGIDPGIAARVHEMFSTTGGDAESAARRLGVLDEYNRRGGMYMTATNYDPTKYAGATIAGKAPTNVKNLWTTGTPESGKPPPGPDNTPPPDTTTTTNNPTPPKRTAQPSTATEQVPPDADAATVLSKIPANEMPPAMDANKLTTLAKQYGVTPAVALQIYKQQLGQTQGSGGGDFAGGANQGGGD